MLQRLAATAFAVALAAAPASAQLVAGTSTGPLLNVHVFVAPGLGVDGTNMQQTIGVPKVKGRATAGIGARIGYAITSTAAVFANVDRGTSRSDMPGLTGDLTVTHIEVGGRATMDMITLAPYATFALGVRRFAGDLALSDGTAIDLRLSGLLISVGGGAQYFPFNQLALDAGIQLGVGKLNRYTFASRFSSSDGSLHVGNSTTTRLTLGATWYPLAR